MSKRLDPNGLAGAFAKQAPSSALDFLVPVRAPAPAPVAPAPAPVVTREHWVPASPPPARIGRLRRVVHRLQRLLGSALRVAL